MTRLTDTQTILLSTASQRDDRNLLPLPASVRPGGGTAKAMVSLIKRGLAEERHAAEGDAVPYGVFLTAAGAAAIGVELPGEGSGDDARDGAGLSPTPLVPAPAPAKAPSKAATVLAMLERAGGATLPELIAATGWLPHTTRAALTGLRKKGHDVARGRRDGVTCYRVGGAA